MKQNLQYVKYKISDNSRWYGLIADSSLAAAVSNAGGFLIAAGNAPDVGQRDKKSKRINK